MMARQTPRMLKSLGPLGQREVYAKASLIFDWSSADVLDETQSYDTLVVEDRGEKGSGN